MRTLSSSSSNQPKRGSDSGAIGCDHVLQAFNTWAYKREQPSDLTRMRATVLLAVETSKPVEFVMYWGKGPRSTIGQPELDCLTYLQSMASRIERVYRPGAHFHLLLTDTHARLNGHSSSAIEAYFTDISEAANARSMSTSLLSSHLQLGMPEERQALHNEPSLAILVALQRSAAKWYSGSGSNLDAAKRYFAMNMAEKQAVGRCFPSSIFITFNGSDLRELFPSELPIFYMYATRKGCAVKPWFMDESYRPPSLGRSNKPVSITSLSIE